MLFNSFQFAIFLLFVLVVYHGLPRRWGVGVLLAASLAFYTAWVPVYLILLLVEIGINHTLLRLMMRSTRPRIYLLASITFTLGLLAYFKYAAMLVESLMPFLQGVLGRNIEVPEIFLPLGISFYSFQILSLTIDAYRGELDEVPTFWRYAVFISFFPQLIAGPIVRGHQLLPQIERGGDPTWERTRRGFWLIGAGLAKKVIIADFLLAPFVDAVFQNDTPPIGSFYLIALYSFAFQIYFDFSGYTDMARGIALLLGFELPMNFTEPYLSRNPSEFWRNWHITLSRWFSDYLYIPLGGNRRGTYRLYRNLMITMLLGGLWHGASWTYVIWGGCHGVLLVVHRVMGRRPAGLASDLKARDLPKIFLLFNLVCLIWVFFRAPDLGFALHYLKVLFAFQEPASWPLLQVAVVLLCVGLHFAERYLRLRLPQIRAALGQSWQGGLVEGAALGIVMGLAVMVSGMGGDFIYFQF